MRIVALQAVRGSEGLVLVRLLQARIFRIVAVDAQRRGHLCQVKLVLGGWFRAGFVCDVAGVASHVERRMTAALGRNVGPLRVAGEAEIILLISGSCFEQLVFILRTVCVVAG